MVPPPLSRHTDEPAFVDNGEDNSSAGIVLYDEPDDDDAEEQLFIETIRRGALAVQSRRRRLLGRERQQSQQSGMAGQSASTLDLDITSAPLWLLYCGPHYANASSPASESATILPGGFYRLEPTVSTGSPPLKASGEGCGKLICARGIASSSDSGAYGSDTPPSHVLLDWLEIIPPKDDEVRWPNLCDCVKASLGCRTCGNAVGSGTLFKCGPCRRKTAASSSKWSFDTLLATPRCSNIAVSSHWDLANHGEQQSTSGFRPATSDSGFTPAQDQEAGLAGTADEWQLRSEALFNASLLPSLHGRLKLGGSRNSCEPETSTSARQTPEHDDNDESQRLPDSQAGHILARARALRRDLRAFIAQTAVTTDSTPARQRRRPRDALGGQEEDAGSDSRRDDPNSEREFQRRRRAEVLESGLDAISGRPLSTRFSSSTTMSMALTGR